MGKLVSWIEPSCVLVLDSASEFATNFGRCIDWRFNMCLTVVIQLSSHATLCGSALLDKQVAAMWMDGLSVVRTFKRMLGLECNASTGRVFRRAPMGKQG